MAKFDLNKLPEEKRIKLVAEFYEAINILKDRKEIRLFFRDLLTPDEIAMFMRRIQVAVLLKAGATYEDITKVLGVGKDKITNVQKSLDRHGQGYALVVKRLRRKEKRKLRKEEERRAQPFSFTWLKKKYPAHFLLLNLIDELSDYLD